MVLRYLALVSPRPSAPIEPAPESARLEIVLTANPQHLTGLGQDGGGLRVLDPVTLPNAAPDPCGA
jgi:hypothetical protein